MHSFIYSKNPFDISLDQKLQSWPEVVVVLLIIHHEYLLNTYTEKNIYF